MWVLQSQLSMFRNSNIVDSTKATKLPWLVVSTPLKNHGVSSSVWDELTFPSVSGKSNQIPWFQSPPSSSSPFESGPQLGPLKFPSNSPSNHQVIPLSPIPKSSHGICRSAAWNFLTFQSGIGGHGTVGTVGTARCPMVTPRFIAFFFGACVYKSHVTLV